LLQNVWMKLEYQLDVFWVSNNEHIEHFYCKIHGDGCSLTSKCSDAVSPLIASQSISETAHSISSGYTRTNSLCISRTVLNRIFMLQLRAISNCGDLGNVIPIL
jgi:hypothetical protein